MPEPTRMLVFDDDLTEAQASVIRTIYCLINELPKAVQRVVAEDLVVAAYGPAQRDGEAGA
jgi:hypothetical protein